jgi:hypothetical protein
MHESCREGRTCPSPSGFLKNMKKKEIYNILIPHSNLKKKIICFF